MSQKNRIFTFIGEKVSKITYKGYFPARNRLHASKNIENVFSKIFKKNFLKIFCQKRKSTVFCSPCHSYLSYIITPSICHLNHFLTTICSKTIFIWKTIRPYNNFTCKLKIST